MMRKVAAALFFLIALTFAVLGVWAAIVMLIELRMKYGEPLPLVLFAGLTVVICAANVVLLSIGTALRIGWPEER